MLEQPAMDLVRALGHAPKLLLRSLYAAIGGAELLFGLLGHLAMRGVDFGQGYGSIADLGLESDLFVRGDQAGCQNMFLLREYIRYLLSIRVASHAPSSDLLLPPSLGSRSPDCRSRPR